MRTTITVTMLVLAACGGDEKERPAPAPTPTAPAGDDLFGEAPKPPADPAVAARQLWAGSCATCHGADGRGDGAMAAKLTPRPRDHSDPAWQDSVTDAQIAEVIVRGGAAIGKSASMPARPDLAEQPEVLGALVARIRGFRR